MPYVIKWRTFYIYTVESVRPIITIFGTAIAILVAAVLVRVAD